MAAVGGEQQPDMAGRQVVKLAALICLVSLALRLPWAALAHVTPISDFNGYDRAALHWISTGHFGNPAALAQRTPGYPAVLVAVYWTFGHSWKAVGLLQAVVGAVTSGLLVLLAARMVPPRASAIAGGLHALSPTAIVYVPVLANETVTVFLLISGLLCLLAGEVGSGGRRYALFAASGLLFGLMVLVRSASVFLLPGVFLLGLYSPKRRAWQPGPGAALIVAAALVVGPWVVRNAVMGLGATLSTTGGVTLWEGNNDRATWWGYTTPRLGFRMPEREESESYLRTAGAWIRSHPGRYLILSAFRAIRLLTIEPDIWAEKWLVPTPRNDLAIATEYRHSTGKIASVPPDVIARAHTRKTWHRGFLILVRMVLAPLTLVGLWLCLRRWREYAVVIFPVASYVLCLSLTTAHARYRELTDPLLFIPAAWLIWRLASRSPGEPWTRVFSGLAE